MIFGLILAGGIGSRMGADMPKQYLEIGGKPIIVHTLEHFLEYENLEYKEIATRKICLYVGKNNKSLSKRVDWIYKRYYQG